MADDNNVQPTQPTNAGIQTPQAPVVPEEVKNQMQASLALWNGGEMPKPETLAATETTQTVVIPTTQTDTTGTQVAATTTTTPAPEFSFDTLKTKFGYEKPEDALTEIEQLRAAREKYNSPVADEDIEFENEFSEKLFKAVKAGKTKEVYQMLATQEKINELTSIEVSKDNAADIIKYGMQLKYKNLTPEQIDYKYSKQFAVPKKPVQDTVNESDEDYENRLNEWKSQVQDIEMEKMIEAKLYVPELEKEKATLVLPDIPEDEGYLNYKKMVEEQSKLNEEVVNAYKTFTPKSFEAKLNFKDEASKIDFDFQYEPDAESFKKTIEALSTPNKLSELFLKSDGTTDREEFAKVIYFGLNRNRILTEAMKQTKNATIKAGLPDNSNGGLVKQMPQSQQLSDFDKQMQASLAIGGRR
jgi:hypothetical protein